VTQANWLQSGDRPRKPGCRPLVSPPEINYKQSIINDLRLTAALLPRRLKLCQKKQKKLLTGDTVSGILASHTVNLKQQHNTKMRTKTLLIAAAALVAGVVSSEAQVYSANVVGYVNVVVHGNSVTAANPTGTSQYNLLANPFDNGNGNISTNVVDPNNLLPAGSQILTWSGGPSGTFLNVQKTGGAWPASATSLVLAPGTGFFVRNGTPTHASGTDKEYTNTFVGSVACLAGATITNQIPLYYTMQGSPIPYAGNLCISGTANGDANMNFGGPLTKAAQIIRWLPDNAGGATYLTAQKIGGTSFNNTIAVNPGEGFFINNVNGPATNVVETLP
jgi:hypothetical protein